MENAFNEMQNGSVGVNLLYLLRLAKLLEFCSFFHFIKYTFYIETEKKNYLIIPSVEIHLINFINNKYSDHLILYEVFYDFFFLFLRGMKYVKELFHKYSVS